MGKRETIPKNHNCPFEGECFGRKEDGTCDVLTDVPEDWEECSFQKPEAEVTDGIRYRYDKLSAVQGAIPDCPERPMREIWKEFNEVTARIRRAYGQTQDKEKAVNSAL